MLFRRMGNGDNSQDIHTKKWSNLILFLYLHPHFKNNYFNHEKLRDGIHLKSRFV